MKARTLGGSFLILLAGGWIYWPALRGGWVWDDVVDIAQNPVVHDPAGWWKIWLTPSGWHFFPLKTMVQWAQWQLWADHTTGYHVTNLVLHLAGALLLWRLLTRLGVRHGWLGGLLFAVHPLAVESVAWMAELKNTLSFPLLMLAALAWINFDERRRSGDYIRCLAFFILAMLAKSSVVMFPLGVLLHQVWKRGQLDRRSLRAVTPLCAISFTLGIVTLWFEHRQNPAIQALMPALGFGSRLAGAGGAIGFYFLKSIVPTGLSPVYAEWILDPVTMKWFLPWLGVAAALGLCVRHWRTWGRHAGLGLGFFLLNLVPVLGLVPMAYHHVAWVADHFAYLSLAGLVGLAAAAVDWSETKLSGRWRHAGVVAGCMVAAVFAGESRADAAAFKDEETLWTTATLRQPGAWLAHHNLAFALARTSRIDDAVAHYRTALQLKATDADAANNLGNLLLAQHRGPEAVAAYEQAVRIRPAYAEAEANLGNALAQAGRTVEAVAASQQALRLDPSNGPAHTTLADLYSQQGRGLEAVSEYQAALAVQPDDFILWNSLAVQQQHLGQTRDARTSLEKAIALNPGYVEARVNLGYVLSDQKEIAGAVAQWREAVQRASDNVAARAGLGNVFVQSGQPREAEAQYREILRRTPDDAEIHNNLAYALAQQGRIDEAVRECERALQLRPDYAAAKENLERLLAPQRH